jgi:hypothetical protein
MAEIPSYIPTKINPSVRLDFLAALAMDQRLGAVAVRVGIILLSHRNGQTGLICPSHETLAREAGCTVRTVIRAIKDLVEAGWFALPTHQYRDGKDGKRKQTVNRYVPNWGQVGVTSVTRSGVTQTTDRGDTNDREGCHQCHTEPGEGNPVNKNSVNIYISHSEEELALEKVSLETGEDFPPDEFWASSSAAVEAGTNLQQPHSGQAALRQEREVPAAVVAAAGGFSEFYGAYPRKGGRAAAKTAYDALVAGGKVNHRQLMRAAAKYDARMQGDQRKFISGAAKWLDEAQYMNDMPKPLTQAPNRPDVGWLSSMVELEEKGDSAWQEEYFGPLPNETGTYVPPHVLKAVEEAGSARAAFEAAREAQRAKGAADAARFAAERREAEGRKPCELPDDYREHLRNVSRRLKAAESTRDDDDVLDFDDADVPF